MRLISNNFIVNKSAQRIMNSDIYKKKYGIKKLFGAKRHRNVKAPQRDKACVSKPF